MWQADASIKPPHRSTVTRIVYTPDGQARLFFRYPNVAVDVPADELDDPQLVSWRCRKQLGGRHQLHGEAFESQTLGGCRRKWQELIAGAEVIDHREIEKPKRGRRNKAESNRWD